MDGHAWNKEPGPGPGYERAVVQHRRRECVTRARARAARLRALAEAGEKAAQQSEWPEHGLAAAAALRTVASLLTNYPTDPVAAVLLAGLSVDQTPDHPA